MFTINESQRDFDFDCVDSRGAGRGAVSNRTRGAPGRPPRARLGALAQGRRRATVHEHGIALPRFNGRWGDISSRHAQVSSRMHAHAELRAAPAAFI